MCDYSLESVKNRAAKQGDKLVTTRLGPSQVLGLATPADPATAVCVLPDSKLVVTKVPTELQSKIGIPQKTEAVFAKRDPAPAHFRDMLVFPGNKEARLADLTVGIEVEVTALPGEVLKIEQPATSTLVDA